MTTDGRSQTDTFENEFCESEFFENCMIKMRKIMNLQVKLFYYVNI